MTFFSYALAYALFCFVLYLVFKFFRFAFVRLKAYFVRLKLSKLAKTDVNLDIAKKAETEKKDD